MTWEEAIEKIRNEPEFEDLVRLAYFDVDLPLNVARFGESDEFKETQAILKNHAPNSKTILDIGSGNGISAINFALVGYEVTALEPDTSDTVGYGAICKLKEHYKLDSLQIHNDYAENLKFPAGSFDVVYIRQAMHHANDLEQFLKECVRVLKPNGLLLTIRDHVIYNEKDKQLFFEAHPLHKLYGGENAFTAPAYKKAIENAGAHIEKELKYYDSVINYFPKERKELDEEIQRGNDRLKKHIKGKVGFIVQLPFAFSLYKRFKKIENVDFLDETKIAGRMYSYIAIKK